MSKRGLAGVFTGLAANVAMVWGVVVGHWPPGNVWIAFWVESVSVGALTWLRLRRIETAGRAAGRAARGLIRSSMFLPWYGVFTLVQGAFALVTAAFTGVVADFSLWLPVALVLVRFGVDVLDVSTARPVPMPGMLALPITRMVCLHVGVLVGMMLAIIALDGSNLVPGPLALAGVTPRMLPVLVLLVIKTLAELAVSVVLAGRRTGVPRGA